MLVGARCDLRLNWKELLAVELWSKPRSKRNLDVEYERKTNENDSDENGDSACNFVVKYLAVKQPIFLKKNQMKIFGVPAIVLQGLMYNNHIRIKPSN